MQPCEQSPQAIETAIETSTVSFEARAGTCTGLLATPFGDAEWRSAVVVVGNGDGHATAVCQALAAAGHGALALELDLSGIEGGRELSFDSRVALTELTRMVDAAVAHLRAQKAAPARLGVVGYGAAGLVALAAGYRCQVGAAISFYGEGPRRLRANLRQLIDKPKRHAAGLLCLVGGEDADVSPADLGAIRDHLDAFGMRQTMIVYPRTRSGFCHSEGSTYRANEAKDAWGRLLRALETAPRLRHRFPSKRYPPPTVPRAAPPPLTPR